MTAFAYAITDSGVPVGEDTDTLLDECRLDTQEHRDVVAFYWARGLKVDRHNRVVIPTDTGFRYRPLNGRTSA